MKILATQYQNDIEDLQRRLQNVKTKIMAEIKVNKLIFVLFFHASKLKIFFSTGCFYVLCHSFYTI